MLKYRHSNVARAKVLRKNMTPWERKLWYEFLRDYPVRFQRQKPIGNYIVDFYCFKARLVIELDGSQHYNKTDMVKDKIRTEKLEEFNLTVIRIPNNEVDENFYGVCEYIDAFVKNRIDFD
ncbi:MAG: endonuclease domain-containing protein [Clostridia bacterium]|nr:endonuclease domain-containing protein [Clostridia bacterium]